MPQLIFYTFRVIVLATTVAALGIHYLLNPLSKPVVLVLYGIMFVTLLLGLLKPGNEEKA